MENVTEVGNVVEAHNEEAPLIEEQNSTEIAPEMISETGYEEGVQEVQSMIMEESVVPVASQLSVDDIIVEEVEENDDEDKDEMSYADAIIEECHPYEDVEDGEPELFGTIRVEEENPALTVIGSDAGLDLEKSSSFPFDTVGGNSETSEDVTDDQQHPLHSLQDHQQEEEQHHAEMLDGHLSQNLHLHHQHHHHRHHHHGNNLEDNNGSVEISLLASLAGDNANSLPSVGGGESEGLSEEMYKKDDYESKVMLVENCEKMDSESDSLSEPAIAEELVGEDGALNMSDATIINTELVSEDELPPMTLLKPQINDAEEVSDEELPAPKRAELPADAELISDDDELPVKGVTVPPTTDVALLSPTDVVTSNQTPQQIREESPLILGKKRKCDNQDIKGSSSTITTNNAVQVEEDNNEISMLEPFNENEKSHSIVKDKNEQYNPMSPTSESNDSIMSAPLEKKAKLDGM